ncbi:MAG: alpha-amylase family glycosyl hydrolase [Ruminococcus sp.]|nr:alpha-amylase family glycosyl hydrolase [Ruminococcus sp.]
MKKFIALLLILTLSLSCALLSGCEKSEGVPSEYVDPVDARELAETDDKYRNYYHIWVCAFADSNGDEIGDLQGIIDNLDYINDGNPETDTDLGMTGIWLSPIMPSDSYHKYDVDDYMDIDPDFGDLATFDKLIEECDKRGIDVILDLVLNHCGTDHEFYQNALKEAAEGNLDGYTKYYRFKAAGFTSPGEGWRQVIGVPGVWYEGQFSSEMPEWNLAYDGTRDYFEEIAKFWLERGVAGFRLDAVKYMTDETTDGVEFLNWFYTTAQKYNPDVYMVGENWQSNSYLYDLYESGIDSQFAFSFATATGNFSMAANAEDGDSLASQLYKFDKSSREANPNVIHAMFLSNHDQVRIGSTFTNRLNVMKNTAALYLLSPGNTFTYYGEEIGMKTPGNYHQNDAYYRSPMIWDSDVEPDIWCTADAFCELDNGGVKQQTDDENSLLSFYRRAIKIRNQNPEIARGKITETYEVEDDNGICAFKLETEDSAVIIVHNVNGTKASELEITDEMLTNPEIVADLYAGADEAKSMPAVRGETQPAETEELPEFAYIANGKLVLPPRTSVVLKSR